MPEGVAIATEPGIALGSLLLQAINFARIVDNIEVTELMHEIFPLNLIKNVK